MDRNLRLALIDEVYRRRHRDPHWIGARVEVYNLHAHEAWHDIAAKLRARGSGWAALCEPCRAARVALRRGPARSRGESLDVALERGWLDSARA